MKPQGTANVSKLPGKCIQLAKCFIKVFDSAMRLMFPPDASYPAGITTGNQEFCFFGVLSLTPVFFFGWNFWLMMGVLFTLICLNTVRYYLFYDIVDGKHRRKGNRSSSLTGRRPHAAWLAGVDADEHLDLRMSWPMSQDVDVNPPFAGPLVVWSPSCSNEPRETIK